MRKELAPYVEMVEFLGEALGREYEIVLHDLTNPERSIVAIANGELSGRGIGGPVTDFALKILKTGTLEKKSYVANYHGKNVNGHVYLSSSKFTFDVQHKPIGILCINHNITPYLEVRRFLTDSVIRDREMHPKLAGLESQNASVIYENFQGNVSEVIRTLIDKALEGSTKAPSKLSLQEKMSVIEELNENGLFLLKGSIPAIAMKLGVSEPTIYRYLSKVKRGQNAPH